MFAISTNSKDEEDTGIFQASTHADTTSGTVLSQDYYKNALAMLFLPRREARDPEWQGLLARGHGTTPECQAQENTRTPGHTLYRKVTLGFSNKKQY